MSTVVELAHIGRSFGTVRALDDINLTVPSGTVSVLLGPNGAGKTTAVRIITGALPPDTGTITVLGLDPRTDGNEIRRRCGVVPARPALYDRLSGYDNLRYAAQLFEVDDTPDATGVSPAERAIHDAAMRFGIENALTHRVGGYSTGMRARLALARAVLHDPDLLLLDEPTAGLDPESSRAVLGLIDDMAERGRTVLMCTHLLLEAEGLADQVIVMDHGKVLLAGAPEELVHRFWPYPAAIIDTEEHAGLESLRTLPGVTACEPMPNGAVTVTFDHAGRISEMVAALVAAGARVTRVEPRARSLEELYFYVRETRATSVSA
jgi:ABC-2 type transport system ATP-binding protein